MKKLYEESYSTCIFISRISFFALLSFDPDNEEENQLNDKVYEIIRKNKLYNQKNDGFFGQRLGPKKIHWLTDTAIALGFTEFNPIFGIPGCYAKYCPNPKKIYQKWCKAFDNQLTPHEIEVIINASHRENDEWDLCGSKVWHRMKKQDHYSWRSEIRSLYYFWRKKLFSIDYEVES